MGHEYTLLGALRGPHKRMEAHLVTLTGRSEVFPLFQHPGTELLFMLEGEMVYGHGEASYTLAPGDALQIDGEGVHGPQELLASARGISSSTRSRSTTPATRAKTSFSRSRSPARRATRRLRSVARWRLTA
jgi:hypothetical protein